MTTLSSFALAMKGLKAVDPESVQFLMFSDEEIKKLSVVEVTNSVSFDSLSNAVKGGLYDPAMGPLRDKFDFCVTCNNSQIICPGHFGHIKLPLVVINPIFIKVIYTLFRISCLKCYKIQMNAQSKHILKLQLQLMDVGLVTDALDLCNVFIDSKETKNNNDESSKIIKKYEKLLKKIEPGAQTFQNKNTSKLRSNLLSGVFKTITVMKNCIYCRNKLIKILKSENKLMYNMGASSEAKGLKIMLPDEMKRYCSLIAENDEELLTYMIPILKHTISKPITDMFFMGVVPVTPPCIRPCKILGGKLIEHFQSNGYRNILRISYSIKIILQVLSSSDQDNAIQNLDTQTRRSYDTIYGKTPPEKLHVAWQELQKCVNQLLCAETGQGANTTTLGLKEILEKKKGIIRMHMMGKRVNFAGRSVITPDPNVDIDEIGVPDVFAKKLTYPVPVTQWNVDELRKMVINGPNKHPGAELLEMENGRIIKIPADSIQKRKSLAKRLLTPDELKSPGLKIVHRHLLNGDVLILNRQPTLHKPSMMAHKARILKGQKTLRLHYANCKAYNADFDGDEMNAHFPQNEIARSEAYNLVSASKQYLVPKDGTPLSGLIQDHVISGVKMSLRGRFFSQRDYQLLVVQGLNNHRGEIKLLPPAIIKPVMLWSGKQVLSTIIINSIPKGKPYLTLTGKAKISSKAFQKEPERHWKAGGTPFSNHDTMTESEVIIRKGELLCGVLDKTHYGATPYGLVHCMYELYGGSSSCKLLSSFSKLFTIYLNWCGFTLGAKDILVIEEGNKKRDAFIYLSGQAGNIAACKATELSKDVDEHQLESAIEEKLAKDPKFRGNLDRFYKNLLDESTNNINKCCLNQGLLLEFPFNNLQLMVQSGAKGSTVNTMQISCLLGQIELEGKRPPLMISGKSHPSFVPYDTSPRAGGFIGGRFMTGIQPQEFFFHCMAGREGLIDTAVKTSRSGYLQRCLIKHLEGLNVTYDYTVRDTDGSVIQFAYGEDGLDILKSQFLKKSQLEFLDINSSAVTNKSIINTLKEEVNSKMISKSQKSLKKWMKKYNNTNIKIRSSAFAKFSAIIKNDISLEDIPIDQTRDPYYKYLEKIWRSLENEEKNQYRIKTCPEPLSSKISPEYKLGVISENMDSLLQNYLKNRSANLYDNKTEKEIFTDIMNAKYLASMADPGEPVGLLAAQSIGEPSTQMTLNTFHFAGRGDMNVTLGIPRLREILMYASANLKTPCMDIPFLPNIPNLDKKAERLRRKLNKVTVADVLEKMHVHCEVLTEPQRNLKTTIRFEFLPQSQYKTKYPVKPAQIIKHMQKNFFKEMFLSVRKQAKLSAGVVWTVEKEKKQAKRKNEDDDNDENETETQCNAENAKEENSDDDSSDEEGHNMEDDGTDVKNRENRFGELEYEDPESGEEDNSGDEIDLDKDPTKEDVDKDPTKEDDEPKIFKEEISEQDTKAMFSVIETHKNATNYTFDTKNHLWCEITVLFPISFLKVDLSQVLREIAKKSIIYEVKNINRAIIDKDKDVVYIKTEGINIPYMFNFGNLLDLNKIYTNDIHTMASIYGIEAATKVVKKEIQNVFNVYGITVDPRHLSLISDYMTYNGKYEPMSRKGIESSSSPLQQMSFESSIGFLKEAVLNAKIDPLYSPSSCLMLGRPCCSGTGSFSLSNIVQ